MKLSKVTLSGVQDEGMKLAGGIVGASTQGAVSALARKYAPESLRPFVDPATIVAGVMLSVAGKKSDFLQSAGFGMALAPGWSVVQNQLQKIVPASEPGNTNAVRTAIDGATGMAGHYSMKAPNRIPTKMLSARMRNDRFGNANRVSQSNDLSIAM
jgi:hypothetical protein